MATRPEAASAENAALGARFREVRRARKVYLRPLAEALGCSINSIRWMEAGARMMRADQLVKAAHIMGVEPTIFFVDDDGQPIVGGNSDRAA